MDSATAAGWVVAAMIIVGAGFALFAVNEYHKQQAKSDVENQQFDQADRALRLSALADWELNKKQCLVRIEADRRASENLKKIARAQAAKLADRPANSIHVNDINLPSLQELAESNAQILREEKTLVRILESKPTGALTPEEQRDLDSAKKDLAKFSSD